MCQCRQCNLAAYGDLTGRHCIWHHDQPGNTALSTAAGDIARPTCGQFPATLLGISIAWGATFLRQRWLQQARQDVRCHIVARRVGGARIEGAKMATMTMHAPQCGQTKVGGAGSAGALSSVDGAPAGTSSSWRTRARLAFRLALANKP